MCRLSFIDNYLDNLLTYLNLLRFSPRVRTKGDWSPPDLRGETGSRSIGLGTVRERVTSSRTINIEKGKQEVGRDGDPPNLSP